MKKTLLLGLLFSFGVLPTFAQDCNGYFAFKKGTKMELTNYDKKDKATAVIKYEVLDYKTISGGMTLTFANEIYNEKGNLLAKTTVNGKCENGTFYSDVRGLGIETIPQSADLEVSVTGDQLDYPNALKTGDKLKDASVNVKSTMKSMGMTVMNKTFNITDRTVTGFETVETPAGKFECAKITYTTTFKLMGTRTAKSVEYIAKGVGMVKSEQFDEKDRKQSSLLLTKFEQ